MKYFFHLAIILLSLCALACDDNISTQTPLPSQSHPVPEKQNNSDTTDSEQNSSSTTNNVPGEDSENYSVIPTLDSATALLDYLNSLPQNTSLTPYTVKLINIDISKKDILHSLYSSLVRFVSLDLSECSGLDIANTAIKDNPNMINIVSIIFPKTLTTIGPDRFFECTNLLTVEGSQVTTISSNAFVKCTALKSTRFPELTDLKQGSSTTRGVFSNCYSLETLYMPKLKNIGDFAFYDCSSLKTLELPSVEFIGKRVFKGSILTSLTLGETVPALGEAVFENIDPLPNIYVPNINAYLANLNSYLGKLKEGEITGWTDSVKALIKDLSLQ